MPRKFWPTNSVMREGPVKGWGRGTDLVVAISLIRSAQPSKARSSDRTRVLSQSRRMVVIFWEDILMVVWVVVVGAGEKSEVIQSGQRGFV